MLTSSCRIKARLFNIKLEPTIFKAKLKMSTRLVLYTSKSM